MKNITEKDISRAEAKIDKKVSKAIKESVLAELVVYSACDHDENDMPIDNLDEVAIKGKAIIVAQPDDFFGGKESKLYQSPVLENPTWLELTVIANQSIHSTLDEHHVFFEGIDKEPKKIKGVQVYSLVMGS